MFSWCDYLVNYKMYVATKHFRMLLGYHLDCRAIGNNCVKTLQWMPIHCSRTCFNFSLLYGPFCHSALTLDISTLFTTFFLWTSLQFILSNLRIIDVPLISYECSHITRVCGGKYRWHDRRSSRSGWAGSYQFLHSQRHYPGHLVWVREHNDTYWSDFTNSLTCIVACRKRQ